MRHRRASGAASDNAPVFGPALRDRVFATLFGAEVQSLIGDQLARVALTVLVYEATRSAPATAATYAATLLPAVFGGVVVARIGDRWSRRGVMIGCDLFRALCFAGMVVPGMPLAVLIALVVVAVVAGPVFAASEMSYLSARLPHEVFRAANGLRMMATQAAQVIGFVCGGVLVAAIGARPALAIDAGTFAISALLIAAIREGRATPSRAAESVPAPCSPAVRVGVASPWRDRSTLHLVALVLLVGFFVVPEGLAVPLSARLGAQAWVAGMLLAAGALGGALGAIFVVRSIPPDSRTSIITSKMAAACGLPLIVTWITDRWPLIAVAWFVSGFFAAYVVEATTAVVRSVPEQNRAAFVGTMGALLLAAQGAGLIVFGLVAQWISVGAGVAIAGAVGSALALGLAGTSRTRQTRRRLFGDRNQVNVSSRA